LWQLAQQGRWAEARELYQWYTPLLHLDTKIKLVQYIKLCMAEVGLGTELSGPPRLPTAGAARAAWLGIIRYALAPRPALPREADH
ncbi:MAG: dihydrodipicolinate synthase family protein, partial [Acidobacteriota bacterium]